MNFVRSRGFEEIDIFLSLFRKLVPLWLIG